MIYSSVGAALKDAPKAQICRKPDIFYRSIEDIQPGQVRFSSKNVQLKIDEALKKGDAWINQEGCYQFIYDNGQSPFPEKEAVPIIHSCFGYLLADGHHHTLAALTMGARSIPTVIIAKLPHLSDEEFWKTVEEKGWVYLYDLNGQKLAPPKSFNDLIDDPNRYFATITARKCKEDGNLKESIGAEYPLWIKVGKDIPFIEFKISDALRNAGLCYTYEMGDSPPIEFVEAARQVLINAHIPGLRVVPKRKHYSDI